MAVVKVCGCLRVLVKTVGKVRVGVVGVNVKTLLCHLMVVKIPEHAVGGDEIPLLHILSDNICLHFAEGDSAFGDKAVIVQHKVRVVALVQNSTGHEYLIP